MIVSIVLNIRVYDSVYSIKHKGSRIVSIVLNIRVYDSVYSIKHKGLG